MSNYLVLIIILFVSLSAHAEKIGVHPIDCGPLARGEYGVVFRVDSFPKGQTYFSKGKASDLCPELLSGNMIWGYEKKLPESEYFSESERVVIKEFIMVSQKKSNIKLRSQFFCLIN